MKLLPILALLLSALPTFARLGETKAECEKRYGKPALTLDTGEDVFEKDGIQITVTYLKGKAASIGFTKLNRDLELTDAERKTLLKANASNSEWEPTPLDGNDTLRWERADKQAIAIYILTSKDLVINTADFAKHLREAREKETPKLDGF